METSMNGYRYAKLAAGESLCSPETCDCCGREGLKKTIKLINPAGCPVWFGVGCAARAMGVAGHEVRAARADQVEAQRQNEVRARAEAAAVRDRAWQAFLNEAAGTGADVCDWQGPCRFKQIQKLGGMAAARARFEAQA
jgi:hypothetical protein